MQVKIYKPAKTAMQSGKANAKKWVLEFMPENSKSIDPVMGWTSNKDTKGQLRIRFDSKEEAVEYARRENLEYFIIEPNLPKRKIQAYSDNFMD